MQLVADRFLVNDHEVVIDLASGARIELIVSSAGSGSDQIRWAERCGRFAEVRHRAIAALVDYGALGAAHRFEAWRWGTQVSSRGADAVRAISLATEYLRASGLTTGSIRADSIRACGATVVRPDACAGYEVSVSEHVCNQLVTDVDSLGLRVIAAPGAAAITELFADSTPGRPRVIGVYGSAGAGTGVYLCQIARAARLLGYVPLAGAVSGEVARALAARSVLLISRGNPAAAWRRLIDWSAQTSRPPILLVASADEIPSVQTIRLSRLSREQLIAAVQPHRVSARVRRRIESAADRSNGLPGRFAQLLWGRAHITVNHQNGALSRVAERAPTYAPDSAVPTVVPTAPAAAWVSRDELATLRQRMAVAIDMLSRGRHAAGERQLRQVVGSLTRRDDWWQAARGGLALGRSLRWRGRASDARSILAAAHAAASQAAAHPAAPGMALRTGHSSKDSGAAEARSHDIGTNHLLLDIATAEGEVSTDLLQLDAAETALQAAVTAARGLADAASVRSSSLALARCLFWRGRFDEALTILDRRELDDASGRDAVQVAVARSRLAVAIGDLAGARASIVRAEQLAVEFTDPALTAAIAYASAFAHLAVGDFAAIQADLAVCTKAARNARQTLRDVCARLIGAEAARRSGRTGAAAAIVSRIGRIADHLPPIVRARQALLADLLTSKTPTQVVKRQINATGLQALALYVPRPEDSGITLRSVNDIVDILGCCHAAEDDAAVLVTLCGRLRSRLDAATVTFFIPEGDGVVAVASDGGRVDPALGRRLLAAGQPVAPHQIEERIEGGVAVRYGGRPVGALAARWLIGSAVDGSTTIVLLTTAATAAGPALAGIISRRAAAPDTIDPDLLGASTQMNEVRRAVERAAAAPFAVLIEGESGSGKELIARALHRRSVRRDRPFCTLNCAALPDDLVESELFGHARGAFTGALAERPGVFEEAHGGTLFLDEIGELSPRAQAKVLRTIQEGELRRLGENVPRRVDVRLVTATNRDLRQEVAAGRFRLDLLYRIDVLRIPVPPLRDRRDDVPVLAEQFWRESTARVGSRAALSTSTVAALARYDWPGNVRELQNVLASLAVRSPRRGVVSPAALPAQFAGAQGDQSWRLDEARRTFESRFVRAALARSGGHRSRAAEELGVTRQGLTKLMVRLGIAERP